VIVTPIVTLARLRDGATGPCRDAIVALDGKGTFSDARRKKKFGGGKAAETAAHFGK